MIDYKEGDVVVCIATPEDNRPPVLLRNLYTVTGFFTATTVCINCLSNLGVEVAEVHDPIYGACACVFRLAYRPDLSVTLERTIPIPAPPKKQDAPA